MRIKKNERLQFPPQQIHPKFHPQNYYEKTFQLYFSSIKTWHDKNIVSKRRVV